MAQAQPVTIEDDEAGDATESQMINEVGRVDNTTDPQEYKIWKKK